MPTPASSVISISSVSDRVWSFCVVTRLLPGGGSPRAIPAGLFGNQKAEDCEKASEFLENSKNGVIFAKRSSLHIVNLTRHLLFLVLETWKISNTEKPKSMPVLFFSAGGFYGFLCGLSRASGTITEFRPRFVCAGEYGGFLGGLSRASGTITEFRPRFVCSGANAFRKLIFGGGCGNKPYGDSDISVKVFSGLPPFFPVRVSPRNTTLGWLHVLRRTFRGARGRDPRRIVRSHGAVPPV